MIPPRPTLLQRATQGWVITTFGVVLALCLLLWHDGAAWTAWSFTGKWITDQEVPSWRMHSAPEWRRRAARHMANGDFRLALIAISAALKWSPDDYEMLIFKGNMHESLFQFRDAEAVFERVLELNPGNKRAQENLTLCQRINRIRTDPGAHSSTLYALHRVMLDQGRVAEDLAIGRRLSSDRVLWQASWQAALDQSGLQGRITVDDDGAMELDLTGERQPDLSLIRDFPLKGLNLAYTGLGSLRPLQGMELEKLNLTQTVIEDLSPLRGMPLKVLLIPKTGVYDLSPLAACPLQELDVSHTRVFDLAPLAKLPLTLLRANDTPINDLTHLATVRLISLYLTRSRVSDLKPLSHLPLEVLSLEGTQVSDLTPLKGSQLRGLYLASTRVTDLSPLGGMPLKVLTLTNCELVTDMRPLATCTELEHLLLPPHPMYLEMLNVLPRLRFVQREEMKIEVMLL